MNDYKINNCINKIQTEIWMDSSECKTYKLGFAAGANHVLGILRKYTDTLVYDSLIDILKSDECMCGDYFTKIFEASNAINSTADNIGESIETQRNRE